MEYKFILSALVVSAFLMSTGGHAQTAADMEKARNAIWAKEKTIYQDRAKGGLNFYLENTAPNYVGWPPQTPKALTLAEFRENTKKIVDDAHEKLTMQIDNFTLQGDTAVIYYTTHRTVLPNGTPVDQHYETLHVWTRMNGEWRIVGAMAREAPKR